MHNVEKMTKHTLKILRCAHRSEKTTACTKNLHFVVNGDTHGQTDSVAISSL